MDVLLTGSSDDRKQLLSVVSCALDRISSYTVSFLKRHYSIDDVLSRVSFHLRRHQDGPDRPEAPPAAEGGCETVTITEF